MAQVEGAEMWGCWVWKGPISCGVPLFRVKIGVGGRDCLAREPARPLAYEKWRGKIPKGKRVRPKCGVERCVNPFHQKVGPWLEARPNWKPGASYLR